MTEEGEPPRPREEAQEAIPAATRVVVSPVGLANPAADLAGPVDPVDRVADRVDRVVNRVDRVADRVDRVADRVAGPDSTFHQAYSAR